MPGKGGMNAIFIVRRMQEEYQKKNKKLYGHVLRRDDDSVLRVALVFEMSDNKKRGRSKKT